MIGISEVYNGQFAEIDLGGYTYMTSDTFQFKSKQLASLFLFTFISVAIPLLAVVLYAAHQVITHFGVQRENVFLLSTPLACGAFIIGGFAVQALDRRYGVRCPHCGHSLTLRRRPKRIAASGTCPDCHESVFDGA
jgi:DNA-directed RNA polymerase subunit RPC12/RpoP